MLEPGGQILIGLSVTGGRSSAPQEADTRAGRLFHLGRKVTRKLGREGPRGVASAVGRRLSGHVDRHMRHWHHGDLLELLRATGFEPFKEHWQKPPYTMVVYVGARRMVKRQLGANDGVSIAQSGAMIPSPTRSEKNDLSG